MIFPFPYFTAKSFYLVRIWLLVWLRPFFPYLWVEFFSLFWKVLFCLYCLVLSWYLFSLPSFASIFSIVSSNFISRSSFPLRPNIFSCSVFLFLLVVEVFLSAIRIWVSIRVLIFSLWSSRGPRFCFVFFHRLLCILYRLTQWCRLSGYLSISRSLYRFRTSLSSSLDS